MTFWWDIEADFTGSLCWMVTYMYIVKRCLKGLAMILSGQKKTRKSFSEARKDIYELKENSKIPVELLKLWKKKGFCHVSYLVAL